MKGAKVRQFYYFCAKLDKENMGKKKKFRFNPETLNYAASLSPEEVETFALDDKPMYIVRRP